VIEPGRGWAYVALFSEIGFVLFVTVMAGVLVGDWVDRQLGTLPVFVVIGALLGLALGGIAVARLIARFLSPYN